MSEKSYCMVFRMNIDCDGCYKKIRGALLHMHDLDSHWIEKTQNKVTVCGTFDPQALAIRMRAATNRRVEILQATELGAPAAAHLGGAAAPPKLEEIKNCRSDGDNSSSAAVGTATGNHKKRKKKKKKKVQFDS